MRITYLIEELSPFLADAIAQTAKNPNKSVQILVQLQDDTPNAKIQITQTYDILKDLSTGLRVNRKTGNKVQGDFEAALAEIKTLIEDRIFSSRLKGHIKLIFYISQGSFSKLEEVKNQVASYKTQPANSEKKTHLFSKV